jgi:hypothetical protein
MNKFFGPPVAQDRCRVEAILAGVLYSEDMLVETLKDEVLRFENLVSTRQQVATLRGTEEGAEIVVRQAHRFLLMGKLHEGKIHDGLLGVLWLEVHGPKSPGWGALDKLGGSNFRARPVFSGRRWAIEPPIHRNAGA